MAAVSRHVYKPVAVEPSDTSDDDMNDPELIGDDNIKQLTNYTLFEREQTNRRIVSFCYLITFTFLLCIMIIIPYIARSKNRPIIGILTLPCHNMKALHDTPFCVGNPKATTFLETSYVKWLEGAGATIVPIQSDDSFTNVNRLLPQLNGVLFTGGVAYPSSFWYSQLQNILTNLRKFAKSSRNHESIPLWTTCLGFEYMQCAIAGSTSLHKQHISEDKALNIDFTSKAKGSEMFNSKFMDQEYSKMVYNKLSTENLTMHFHKYGISASDYTKYPYLDGNFSILGTNIDDNGAKFVSLIQSKDNEINGYLNWYGSQFHPEKPQYAFYANRNNIVHSLDTIIVNQYFADFFVNQCRIRNSQVMDKNEYNKRAIHNYNPVIVDHGTKTYEYYLFEKPE